MNSFFASATLPAKETMLRQIRMTVAIGLSVCATVSLIADRSWADLQTYLNRNEPAFGWKLNDKTDSEQPAAGFMICSSCRRFGGREWRHQLQVYQPAEATPGAKMFSG